MRSIYLSEGRFVESLQKSFFPGWYMPKTKKEYWILKKYDKSPSSQFIVKIIDKGDNK